MSGPIQTQPRGLLSLLDLKTGRYPGELGETMIPTIDQLTWLIEGGGYPLETQQGTFTVLNASSGPASDVTSLPANLIVPIGELWYVRRCYVRAAFSAAASSTLNAIRPIIVKGGTLAVIALRHRTITNFPYVGPATASQVVVESDQDFILNSGDSLSYEHGGFTFGASTLSPFVFAQFLRLKA